MPSTKASKRKQEIVIIPLHSKTLKLGFLNYVTQIKTSKSAEIVPKPKENEKHRLWNYD